LELSEKGKKRALLFRFSPDAPWPKGGRGKEPGGRSEAVRKPQRGPCFPSVCGREKKKKKNRHLDGKEKETNPPLRKTPFRETRKKKGGPFALQKEKGKEAFQAGKEK